jgi:hypothetical protein
MARAEMTRAALPLFIGPFDRPPKPPSTSSRERPNVEF